MADPYDIVREFEKTVAEFAGAKYGVAVESGSAALFLSCLHEHSDWGALNVTIPSRTYPSVACAVINAGHRLDFFYDPWSGVYELGKMRVYDCALRLKRRMCWELEKGFQACLSFHSKKHLAVGRGGMILTNNENTARWLRLARFDGRTETPLQDGGVEMVGWNMYMTPEQAARGLELFRVYVNKWPDGAPDLDVEAQGYPDLSQYEFYKGGR